MNVRLMLPKVFRVIALVFAGCQTASEMVPLASSAAVALTAPPAAARQDVAEGLPLMVQLSSGGVPAGRTPDSKYWVNGFEYRLPKNPTGWVSFVEGRDVCRAEGLGLCSMQQLDLICVAAPAAGKVETWTTNYLADGRVWTRGGANCAARRAVAPADQSPTRGVLCCERRPAIVLGSLRRGNGLAKAANVYMTRAEAAMNSRDPDQVMELAAPAFYLYSGKTLRDQAQARKDMAFDLSNGTEFDNRLVACSARIADGGKRGEFECESVTTRKLNTREFRELGMLTLKFRFVPPRLKYDTWAVGTKIVRSFKPLE